MLSTFCGSRKKCIRTSKGTGISSKSVYCIFYIMSVLRAKVELTRKKLFANHLLSRADPSLHRVWTRKCERTLREKMTKGNIGQNWKFGKRSQHVLSMESIPVRVSRQMQKRFKEWKHRKDNICFSEVTRHIHYMLRQALHLTKV